MTNEEIIDAILAFESGIYTNNPTDKGGPTKWGITAQTLGDYRKLGRPATIPEIIDLSKDEASKIYLENYIMKPKFNLIENDMIRWFMVDSGVVHGPVNPVNWLQFILGEKMTGIMTGQTIEFTNAESPIYLMMRLPGARAEAIGRQVVRDINQRIFLVGWLNRINAISEKAALTLSYPPKQSGNLLASLWRKLTDG